MGEIKINPILNVHQNYNRVNIVNPYRYEGGGGAVNNLDTYSGAKAAYSLREVYSSYSGNIFTLRRDLDGATQAFSLVNGAFPETEVLNFAGGGNAFGTVWNDMSGFQMNAVQTDVTKQPKLVSNGVLITENGKPAWDFQDSFFIVPSSDAYFAFMHQAAKYTVIAVMSFDTSLQKLNPVYMNNGASTSRAGVARYWDNRNNNNSFAYFITKAVSGQTVLDLGTANFFTNLNTQNILYDTYDLNNATPALRHDGNINLTNWRDNSAINTNTTANAWRSLEIGGGLGSGLNLTGKYQELIIWDAPLSQQVQTEVNNFYGTY